MNRWLWLSPILAVLLGVSVFYIWGWSWTAAGLIALVVAGTSIMIWITVQDSNPPDLDLKIIVKKSKGKRL